MPRDAVSRTANVERNGGHIWVEDIPGGLEIFPTFELEIQIGAQLRAHLKPPVHHSTMHPSCREKPVPRMHFYCTEKTSIPFLLKLNRIIAIW